jgi:hypothetical protein
LISPQQFQGDVTYLSQSPEKRNIPKTLRSYDEVSRHERDDISIISTQNFSRQTKTIIVKNQSTQVENEVLTKDQAIQCNITDILAETELNNSQLLQIFTILNKTILNEDINFQRIYRNLLTGSDSKDEKRNLISKNKTE